MKEVLKIQYGDVYVQIPNDKEVLDNIKLAISTLEFMANRIKEYSKNGQGYVASQ